MLLTTTCANYQYNTQIIDNLVEMAKLVILFGIRGKNL